MAQRKVLFGTLDAFWETGADYTFPSFYEDNKPGYDGFHLLKKGDLLTVFSDAARTQKVWEGEVDLDFQIGRKKHDLLGIETQHAGHYKMMHGIPKGIDPDVWGDMLDKKLPATLFKNVP